MCVEQPSKREYVCAPQGQQLLELQFAKEKLKQSPTEYFKRYHEIHEVKVHRLQPAGMFNSHMAFMTTKPISYLNSRVSEGAAYRRSQKSKRPVHSNFPKINQEVAAFGPKHAEHARRVYQSRGTQPFQKFNQTTFYNDPLKGQVPVPITSQTYETVLKVAQISPRSYEKQPTKTSGLKVLHHKAERGLPKKSNISRDRGCEIDLSNAPIFQTLCEISNTL